MAEWESFDGTAALLRLAGIRSITKRAVSARFQKCGEWLQWPRERMRRNNEAIIEPTERLGGRKVYVAGAGSVPDGRPRCAIGLFDLGMKEMALTGTE
jgi:hypothetical protein